MLSLIIMREKTGKKDTRIRAYGDIFRDSKAENYLRDREDTPQWQREDAAFRAMLDGFADGIRVLDVPLGTGRFVPLYLQKRMAVTGVDISLDMLSAAQEALGDSFAKIETRAADAADLPFPDRSFDLVVCFRFLANIVDSGTALKSLREFRRVSESCIAHLKMRSAGEAPAKTPRPNEPIDASLDRRGLYRLLRSTGWNVSGARKLYRYANGAISVALLLR